MADYDLSRLSPRDFEHMAQALAIGVYGPTLQVYGDGPDGGRDGEVVTDGIRLVLQAKFLTRQLSPSQGLSWILQQARAELETWPKRQPEDETKKTRILFITNAVLSAVPGKGVDAGLTQIQDLANDYALEADLWHYDKVCRLLDSNESVRRSYAGLICPGDLIEILRTFAPERVTSTARIFMDFALKERESDQWIRLSQAGSHMNEKVRLGEIAVDLPFTPSDGQQAKYQDGVARQIITWANENGRSSSGTTAVRNIAVLGGPGQGKTTISQILAQLYRDGIRQLNDEPPLADDEHQLSIAGIPAPQNRRWPIRIEAAELAAAFAENRMLSLIQHIANKVNRRSPELISSGDVYSWLRDWPWFIVLDGLDEVPAPDSRELVFGSISDFLIDAARVDADVVMVATTRPQGYNGELPTSIWKYVRLSDFTPSDAQRYAEALVNYRHNNDPTMVEVVSARMNRATKQSFGVRLMSTPLQVTIVVLLLERLHELPKDRFQLFNEYFDTIYDRESAKPGELAQTLSEMRPFIVTLHQAIAIRLQINSELTGGADTSIGRWDLRQLANRMLNEDEWPEDHRLTLCDRIERACIDRLVLLVPQGTASVGFEVRSFQEFLAGCAITAGSEESVLTGMESIAAGTYWRNTWLFAAGRLKAYRPNLLPSIVEICRSLDSQYGVAGQIHSGALLAVDLAYDNICADSPRLSRMLLMHGCEVAGGYLDPAVVNSISTLGSAAASDNRMIPVLSRTIAKALASESPRKVTGHVFAVRLQETCRSTAWSVLLTNRPVAANIFYSHKEQFCLTGFGERLRPVGSFDEVSATVREVTLLSFATERLGSELNSVTPEFAAYLDSTKVYIVSDGRSQYVRIPRLAMPAQPILVQQFDNADFAEQVLHLLNLLEPGEWAVAAAFQTLLRQWSIRRPMGEELANCLALTA